METCLDPPLYTYPFCLALDYTLGSFNHAGRLLPGGNYTMIATVTIPERIFGPFVIRVQTDSRNQVYEHTNENDNFASSMVLSLDKLSSLYRLFEYIIPKLQLTLQVTLAPPPDLVVTSVQASDSYITGDTMTVVYNISNAGAGETDESYWQDQVVSC